MDRKQLADFLRVRRAALQPADVSLPEGSRRRTPGLRRQEVAQLAGISIEYYIRLEQARSPQPSRQVLGALARTLMLDRYQRTHLFHLAGAAPDPTPAGREVPPVIRNLLDGLDDFPAYVVNAAYDMLAWNGLADRFMGGLSERAPEDRNVLRHNFTGPGAAGRLADPQAAAFARDCVADVRASLARNPGDTELRDLVDDLLRTSPEFGRMWADHDVWVRGVRVKRVVHPRLGPLEFACQVLEVTGEGLRLIMYVPEPGSATAEAMSRLAGETEKPAAPSGTACTGGRRDPLAGEPIAPECRPSSHRSLPAAPPTTCRCGATPMPRPSPTGSRSPSAERIVVRRGGASRNAGDALTGRPGLLEVPHRHPAVLHKSPRKTTKRLRRSSS
ncbi:helix-turn-helix transcriptional regulator [Salininema proteolyticum]|uniref:Helix-turn-helix transcriptional regulator n=1 Tax=Salininema proteolyticum TaxID=1607685 RepID=A0ABV8TXF4_9ACTN